MNHPISLFNLAGRVAIVTGACGQLGTEYVKTLLAAGVSVVAFDRREPAYDSVLATLDTTHLLFAKVDVTSKGQIDQGLALTVERFGKPDILINNAAIDAPPGANEQETGPFEEYSEASWQSMMDVNLKGMFLCCQVLGGAMARSKGGSIINIASIYGILSPDQHLYEYRAIKTGKPFYKPVAYSVAKSGVLNLTRYLATYWAEQNVRVNTLTLGGVFNNQDDEFVKGYNNKVPLGRMARAEEYNGAIVFLASDASSYMTGSNLVIDGGYSSW